MNVDKDYLGRERGSAEGEGKQERVGRELELVPSHLQSSASAYVGNFLHTAWGLAHEMVQPTSWVFQHQVTIKQSPQACPRTT